MAMAAPMEESSTELDPPDTAAIHTFVVPFRSEDSSFPPRSCHRKSPWNSSTSARLAAFWRGPVRPHLRLGL